MTKKFIVLLQTLTESNKYTKWYISIVDKALCSIQSDYTEKHHIVPKCFALHIACNINNPDNIVALTAKEHFICHLLLTKMFKCPIKNRKMNFAFFQLRLANKHQKGKRYNNSRMYSYIKKHKPKYKILYFADNKKLIDESDTDIIKRLLQEGWVEIMPEKYKKGRVGMMAGKKHSLETKSKMSISSKRIAKPWLCNRSPESIKQSTEKAKETKKQKAKDIPGYYNKQHLATSERNKRLFKEGIFNVKGSNNPRYGAKLTQEHINLLRLNQERKGCGGLTHHEVYTIFIKPMKEKGASFKEISKIIPFKKRPYDLSMIDKKFNLPVTCA